MKFLLNAVGILAAAVVGYLAEPIFRYQLTGIPPGANDDFNIVLVQVDPDGNTTRIRINIADLKPEQLPARVVLKDSIEVANASSGVTMQIDAGSSVKPLRIENGGLVVSPGVAGFEGRVAVPSTDLMEQLASGPRPTEPQPNALATRTDPAAGGMGGVPDSLPDDPMGQTAGADPAMDARPEPEPEPAPEPEPDPEPEPEPEMVVDTGPVDVVKTMQGSIKAGEITTFTFDQVTEWKEAEDESIDGEDYQIGLAAYQAETFLGVQTIQAKALIRGGKVQRWVMAQSGFEIK